jgi:hypothetical protein
MQTNATGALPNITFNILTFIIGIMAGSFLFLRYSHKKMARGEINAADPAQLPQLAIDKLQEYIDFNMLKMKWAFFCTMLGMLSGLAIIVLGIIRFYESPASIHTSMITSGASLCVEFFSATFFAMYRLTVTEARKSMLILQKTAALASVKNMLSRKKELTEQALMELSQKILEFYSN